MRRIVLLVILAQLACEPQTKVDTETPDLPRHEMIFSRHSDPARTDYDIWRMCGDGTQMASLVAEPGEQLQPSVAPDGCAFVYTSRVGGPRDI